MSICSSVEEALEDIRRGKIIIVVDDENRENEGDFVIAAEKVTAETLNFMATHGRGLICMPIEDTKAKELNLHPMVEKNTDTHGTAFTVSIDYVDTTTGISAGERALTIKKVVSCQDAHKFKRPGHIFPLISEPGGVLQRPGHTEAAVDLARLAGLKPAGVICEIMNKDGSMARIPELIEVAHIHQLKIVKIADIITYRKENETFIERVTEIDMPTKYGNFRMYGFRNMMNGEQHVALVKGDFSDGQSVLTRMHSECLTGDALGSKRCDCGEQYEAAMKKINDEGRGVLLYLKQEGRGIGLLNKLKAYALQDQGYDTVEANRLLGFPEDMRDYDIGAQILKDLGVKTLRLMTNNPRKIDGLRTYGLGVVERIPIQMKHNEKNAFYLKTKKEKLEHMLDY